MLERLPPALRESFAKFTRRHWMSAGLLYVLYTAFAWISVEYVASPSVLFPAAAIAMAMLFLEGIRIWPAILLGSFTVAVTHEYPLIYLLGMPIAHTLQAVLGASMLRAAKVDPLFRRSRDFFYIFATVLITAALTPTVGMLYQYVHSLTGVPVASPISWGYWYTANLFCLLILVPFILRWFTKPRFSRTPGEVLETTVVFVALIGLTATIFSFGITTFMGLPLVYLLLIPLFWIALRLRPRFVTLALVFISIFGMASVLINAPMSIEVFRAEVFQVQAFIITLATIFFVIVSTEENRRLNKNLLKTQLATLENAIARISSESSAKNDFIAVLAHELRNPLAPIASSIEILKLTPGRDNDELDTLSMMEDRMQTIRRLLDDLLDISRISEGKITLKREVLELEPIVRRAVVSTEHYFHERHQSLALRIPKGTLCVYADPVRLEQVFSNLLTNASKYSDSGEHITLTVTREGEDAKIVVRDHGIGIDPSALEHIFTPFHQAASAGRGKSGLGIGLALVKSFVSMHDGTITAESKGRGEGSTFTVLLPLVDQGETNTKPRRRKASASGHVFGRGISILIVDDNEAAAWSMGKLLELSGCTVLYAYDGAQAVAIAEDEAPNVILLDLGLPDQDGYTVAKTLQARGYSGRLIALTGFSTAEAMEKGRMAGFDEYLIKPAGMADLKRVIPEIA